MRRQKLSNFWELSSGGKPSGSEAASFASNFMQIPDNTQANACVKSFEPKEFDGQKSYQVVWELLDGEFKGALVRQSITPFAQDVKKADRSKEMFVRLYNLCELKPKHANEPTKEDLAVFQGKSCSIKIGNGLIQGVERTWIREIHEANKLAIETGHTAITTSVPSAVNSAFSRNPKSTDMSLGDDVPF